MTCNQKTYEAQIYAKQHYLRLLSARSAVQQFKNGSRGRSYSSNRTLTPQDRFEYQLTNDKLCHKLMEIYQDPPRRPKPKQKRSKKEGGDGKGKALNTVNTLHSSLTNPQSVQSQNVRLFQRLLDVKSAVGEDWKKRKRSLKKYGKLTRKQSS